MHFQYERDLDRSANVRQSSEEMLWFSLKYPGIFEPFYRHRDEDFENLGLLFTKFIECYFDLPFGIYPCITSMGIASATGYFEIGNFVAPNKKTANDYIYDLKKKLIGDHLLCPGIHLYIFPFIDDIKKCV